MCVAVTIKGLVSKETGRIQDGLVLVVQTCALLKLFIKTTCFPGAIEEGTLTNCLNVVVSLDRKEVIGSV